MGRDRRNENRAEHFASMHRGLMETDALSALSLAAQAIYPWLLLEWHGPKANNNGTIRLSVRQAADRLGVSRKVAAEAFHELQRKGFVVVVEAAQLGLGSQAKGPGFELTSLALPWAEDRRPRKLYETWRPGFDFPVHKAVAQNPSGANGKTRSTRMRLVQ